MQIIIFLLRGSRTTVSFSLLAGILSGATSALLIALVHMAMDRSASLSVFMISSFIALCIIMPVSRIISQVLLVKLSQRSVRELRLQLSRRVVWTPLRTLEELGAHRITATLTDDVTAISAGLTSIPMILIQATVVIACLVYLGYLSLVLCVAVTLLIVLGVSSVQFAVRRALKHLIAARTDQDALFKHIRALIDGAKELKLHSGRRQAFLDEVLEGTAISFERHNVVGNTIFSVALSWATVLFFIQIGLILFVLPRVLDLTPQTLIGCTLTLLYALVPLDVIGTMLPSIARANVALGNINSLGLALPNAEPEPDSTVKPPTFMESKIEFKGVVHAYYNESENSSFALGPLDLTINPGEILFIIGGNGSGKTTLAKLLTGLYAPLEGIIQFRDLTITDQTRDHYRRHFSAVFSDFFLFESFLGLDKAQIDNKARAYLSMLQLENKVSINNGALSTLDLSQGQRKRLALLSAYLEDRPIYLFDEWAADQDPKFKEFFYLNLLPDLKANGKTIVVISHDDKYYHVADRILKLDYGKIEYDKPARQKELASAL
jgi:putative pyoverdin transport system ATP-binding/permease protein